MGLKLLVVLAFASIILAGPGAWIEIINETPYEWKRVYKHSYQMDWRPVDLIPSGIENGVSTHLPSTAELLKFSRRIQRTLLRILEALGRWW
jgi:hypothetical protein